MDLFIVLYKKDMSNNTSLSLDNQLCFAIYSTSLAMTQLYKPLLEPLGITYPQYLILLILWEQDGVGLKDIAKKLNQKSGALTPVIKRMEQDHLVDRIRLPHDERSLSIRLTPKGHQLCHKAQHVNQCVFQACGMSNDDLIDLKNKINQLREKLRQSPLIDIAQ